MLEMPHAMHAPTYMHSKKNCSNEFKFPEYLSLTVAVSLNFLNIWASAFIQEDLYLTEVRCLILTTAYW